MKKYILLIAIIFIASTANSQSSKREEGIKLGLKAGINASNFNGDINGNEMRNGLHIGILSEIIINDQFSVQPELLFSAQGSKDKTEGANSTLKFDYVILPVMVKYYVVNNLSIEAGPQVGFLVNSFQRDSSGNTKIEDQSIVDFGVNAGLGYEFTNGLFLQGRYNLGITNVNNSTNADAFKITNSVFQVSIGVLF